MISTPMKMIMDPVVCKGCKHFDHRKSNDWIMEPFWCRADREYNVHREYNVPINGSNRVRSDCLKLQEYATLQKLRDL